MKRNQFNISTPIWMQFETWVPRFHVIDCPCGWQNITFACLQSAQAASVFETAHPPSDANRNDATCPWIKTKEALMLPNSSHVWDEQHHSCSINKGESTCIKPSEMLGMVMPSKIKPNDCSETRFLQWNRVPCFRHVWLFETLNGYPVTLFEYCVYWKERRNLLGQNSSGIYKEIKEKNRTDCSF